MPKEKNELKLLFVNPCLRPGSNGFTKLPPLGLAAVMTYFESKGYNFTLLDIDINEYSDNYVENYIKNNHFDFILIGTIITHYKWIKQFVNMTKKYQPDSCVIVGNSVAGAIPDLFLNKTKGDIVVTGEGEISAYEAVEAVRLGKDLKTVTGISFRNDDGTITTTEHRKVGDINDFPFINWDYFDIERYINQKVKIPSISDLPNQEMIRSMPIISARGCAFRCSFCHFVYWDDPYRNRTPESILGEIKYLIEKYNVNHIDFFDDLTFASAHQVVKLCDAIEKSGLKFKWSASIRVDLFSRAKLSFDDSLKVAKRMKANGCIASGFALESGNKEILKMMNKEIDPSEFLTTVKIMREAEIYVPISVIFGYPIETKETIKETFDQCVKAGIYPSIGFLLPLPYTAMYDYAKANGYITDEDRYLDSITERQDICVNMTKLSDKVIMDEIKIGAADLNDMLKLGLTEETYIKTKGYKTSKKFFKKGKHALDPENIKRIENDVSFNYSQTEFKFEEQQNC